MKRTETPDRARTRHEDERAKAEARRKLRAWGFDATNGARVGKWASTHGRPCSCSLCRNPEPSTKFKGLPGGWINYVVED